MASFLRNFINFCKVRFSVCCAKIIAELGFGRAIGLAQ